MCKFMNTDKEKVKIVIPVYKERLSGRDLYSLKHNISLLGHYPAALLVPQTLNTEWYEREFGSMELMRVSDEWLGKNGIDGYNRMMLSKEFYELFEEYEYILICQTDVWIFRDELLRWCDAAYDYVGAPWPKRKVYDRPFVRQWLQLRQRFCDTSKRIIRQQGFNKVGNGGLSLRRVEAFIEGCDRYEELIEVFKNNSGTLYNEDWFWSIIPSTMRYPTLEEALHFSFDIRPEMCYRLTGGELPFGCHGWFKRRHIAFWSPIIEGRNYSASGRDSAEELAGKSIR